MIAVTSVPPCSQACRTAAAFKWMQDWFGPDWYAQGPVRFACGPPAGQDKVCGGGNFGYPCWGTRTTDRGHHLPVHRSLGLGFIIARDF